MRWLKQTRLLLGLTLAVAALLAAACAVWFHVPGRFSNWFASARRPASPAAGARSFSGAQSSRFQPLASGESQRWAVLIGINDYRYAQDLKYARSDVEALRKQLIAAGFEARHIRVLTDAEPDMYPSRANIEQEIEMVLSWAEEGDQVLIAFSGHGIEHRGKMYLCPADAVLGKLSTLVSLEWLEKELRRCPAAVRLVLIDACRADPQLPGGRSMLRSSRRFLELMNKERLRDMPEGTVSW